MKRSFFTAALLIAGLGTAPLIGVASAEDQADANAPRLEAEQSAVAWLGVQAQPLDFETADLVQVPRGTGLYLDQIAQDSPAAAAELRPGDVLLKLDDQLLINPEQLAVLIATQQPGDQVTLTILRNGEELNLPVTLGKTDAEQAGFGPGGKSIDPPDARPAPRQDRPAPPPRLPDLAPIHPDDLPEHMLDIERQIHEHQQRILRFIEEMEGARPGDRLMPFAPVIPGLHDIEDIQQRHQQMIREMQRRMQQQPEFQGQHAAQRQVVISDGEHTIRLAGDAQGWQSLTLTDRQGDVLYQGDYPETDEQWQQIPEGLREKIKQIEDNRIRLEINPREIKPEPKPAPPLA